ncbi:hypothetical protein B5G95_17660, partial [Listeria monocytogenes]|nr:hypothetical protein [Listeria monocytogenes]
DEILIKNFLSLDLSIQKLVFRRDQLRKTFYLQNMATHIEYVRLRKDTYAMVTKGFRPDREVEKLLLNIEKVEHRIDRYKFRRKHFSSFWDSLEGLEQTFLIERFIYQNDSNVPQVLIDSVLDEINEIETAICFREGIEPDVLENELTGDVEVNLERMCDFFAL